MPPAPVFRYNYDEGHAGRYSVPATDGASLDPAYVLQRPDPLQYVASRLTFHRTASDESPRHATFTRAVDFAVPEDEPLPVPEEAPEDPGTADAAADGEAEPEAEPEADGDAETEVDTEAAAENNAAAAAAAAAEPEVAELDDTLPEVTIFIPGLNTVHEPLDGEMTTVDRLIHYVRVLQVVSMAQLHLGTSFDQAHLHVDAGSSPLFRALMDSPVLPSSLKGAEEWR